MKYLYIVFFSIFFFQCNNKERIDVPKIEKQIITTLNSETLAKKKLKMNKNNDTLSKVLFKNGKVKYLILVKDSIDANELHLSFYENGNLESKGLQGNISNKSISTGMSIATWFYYDANKNLDSTIYYNNAEFGKDFIEKRRFYKNGNKKSIERYNNYILYENELDSIDIWKYYNENGDLIKSIDH